MTEPAKLVNKQYGVLSSAPHGEPLSRTPAGCPAEARVVVQSASDPSEVPVPPSGELTVELQQRIIASVVKTKSARVVAVAPEGQRGETLQRCEFLRSFTPLPAGAHDCVPQQP